MPISIPCSGSDLEQASKIQEPKLKKNNEKNLKLEPSEIEEIESSDDDPGHVAKHGPRKYNPKESKPKISLKDTWKHEIITPHDYKQQKNITHVAKKLNLNYIYGYRIKKCRNNLFFSRKKSDRVIYPAAGCVVFMDIKERKQIFYTHHTDDVVSIAYHPESGLIASGQVGEEPSIHIYSEASQVVDQSIPTIKILTTDKVRAICSLTFSPSGKYLVAVGDDDNHTIFIYDWERNSYPICKVHGHSQRILNVAFNPLSNYEFITVGEKLYKFWSFNDTNQELSGKNGIFGDKNKISTLLSIAHINDSMVATGTTTGNVLIWKDHKVFKSISAHDGPVHSILYHGDTLLTGGGDCLINTFNMAYEKINCIDLKNAGTIKERQAVRSFDFLGFELVVGFEDSTLSLVDHKTGSSKVFMNGHRGIEAQEIWGLSVNPDDKNTFASCSDDGTLRTWNTVSHTMIHSTKFNAKVKCCEYNNKGVILAAGLDNGQVVCINSHKLDVLFTIKDSTSPITEVKFSPDGTRLAVCSKNFAINIYDSSKQPFFLKASLQGHTSHVIHVDFSSNGKYLISNSTDCEVLYWNLDSCTQEKKLSELKDISLATNTCTRSWATQGIWQSGMDATDINSCDVDPS
ncbi:WD40 repeat-like protein, partial [Rozella allomycis CSF55]